MEESKTYRTRLILGEGNFSYARAVLEKHNDKKPGLGKFIYATEFESEERLRNFQGKFFEENINYLRSKEVKVLFNIDATNLKASFPDQTFSRVHFNCPFPNDASRSRELIYAFFQSVSQIQKEDDKVYMALALGGKESKEIKRNEANTYGTLIAAINSGYEPSLPRKFDNSRYPQYKHSKSIGGNRKATPARQADYQREYVFIKTNKPLDQIKREFEEKHQLKELPVVEIEYGDNRKKRLFSYPDFQEEEVSSNYSSQEYNNRQEKDDRMLDKTSQIKHTQQNSGVKVPQKRFNSESTTTITPNQKKLRQSGSNFKENSSESYNLLSLDQELPNFLNETSSNEANTKELILQKIAELSELCQNEHKRKKESIEELRHENERINAIMEKKLIEIEILKKEVEKIKITIEKNLKKIESIENEDLALKKDTEAAIEEKVKPWTKPISELAGIDNNTTQKSKNYNAGFFAEQPQELEKSENNSSSRKKI